MQVSISRLSKADGKRLVEMSAIINAEIKGFLSVGNALAEIKRDRLYRETHNTFKSYCNDRWDIGSNYAKKLIASTEAVNRIVDRSGTIVPVLLPTTESQTRELAKVDESEQAEVWAKVVEVTDKPTAKVVHSVVKKWNKLKEKLSPKPKEPKKSKAEVIEVSEVVADSRSDAVSDAKPKVSKRDAPMPEWFMDGNSVAVPLELYPAWLAKQRFFELANAPVAKDTCDQIVSFGQELNQPATIELGREMWTKLSRFQNEFRREIASGEPSVLSENKTAWMSKREVKNA